MKFGGPERTNNVNAMVSAIPFDNSTQKTVGGGPRRIIDISLYHFVRAGVGVSKILRSS